MIKTENGNHTLTFEEFAEEVRKLVPAAKEEPLREAYDQIRRTYVIGENCATVASPRWAEQSLRYIKEGCRREYSVIIVRLSYDCGPLGFCPQDCPRETLLVNKEDGDVMTETWIHNYFSEQRGKSK